MHDFIVIGSGLSGVSAAKEILAAGKSVLMIDIGKENSENALALQKKIKIIDASTVQSTIIKSLDLYSIKNDGKNWFGDRITQWWTDYWIYKFKKCAPIGPSVNFGGFSKNWGGSCMPYELLLSIDNDLYGDQSTEFIDKVYELLSPKSPSKIDYFKSSLSKSLSAIEKLFLRASQKINVSKWKIAQSKIAVSKNFSKRCNKCGSCLAGCHADLIMSSENDFKRLMQNVNFQYINNKLCVKISESSKNVVVKCIDLSEKGLDSVIEYKAKRVILAAGPLSSTNIISASLNIIDNIPLKTSQLISFPLFSKNFFDFFGVRSELGVGVSELSIFNVCKSMPNTFLQLYSSNRILRYYVGGKFFSLGIGGAICKFVDKISIACQGFLDSDNSPVLNFKRLKNDTICLSSPGRSNLNFDEIKTLFTGCGYIIGKIKIHDAGDGYHFGSSFPPKKNANQKFYSDQYGRPMQLKRTHIVDASVLSYIPAGPFTSVSLANTFRIIKKILENY